MSEKNKGVAVKLPKSSFTERVSDYKFGKYAVLSLVVFSGLFVVYVYNKNSKN